MFNVLKKLTSKQDAVEIPHIPMCGSLQKKFSRGVNYNMKIIIKGDRNVGKSCLFKRLQGGGFIESYNPTEEIQVASIQWSFKATEDVVKVEVWDVVDKGKARPKQSGLKLSTAGLPETPALDAEFLDVYKGTHGVILVMDVTKAWTFDYVTRELPKVPIDVPVLILANHCDMAHHRVISSGQIQSLIESYDNNRPSEIIYAESSMRNGFGLRLLHKFLGLPFLRLQKETFLALIERNKRDTDICGMEINEYLNSDDADYNKFLNKLSDKRRQIADSNSKILQPSLSNNVAVNSSGQKIPIQQQQQHHHLQSETATELRPTKSIIVGGGQPIIIPGQINITQQPRETTISAPIKQAEIMKLNENDATANKTSILVTTLLKKSDTASQKLQSVVNTTDYRNMTAEQKKIASVEEFCPDEGTLDRSFLDDIPTNTNTDISGTGFNDSDSDNDMNNPMVARFDDEPESVVVLRTNTISLDNSKITIQKNSLINLQQQNIKTNPLAKNNRKSDDLAHDNAILLRKLSISSDDLPGVVSANFESPTDENSDNWIPDTSSIRRSPEGGEDNGSIPNVTQNSELNSKNVKSSSVKKSSSSSSSSSKKKKDKKDSDKSSSRKEKKKKRKSRENDLENFLNGTTIDNDDIRVDDAYEAI